MPEPRQVSRRENATTGTEIAQALRAAGYKGTIVIRSANVSSKVTRPPHFSYTPCHAPSHPRTPLTLLAPPLQATQQYLTAGADAVMSKDESRDRWRRLSPLLTTTTYYYLLVLLLALSYALPATCYLLCLPTYYPL